MKTTVRDQSSRQSGFSLIEILVGMAIGMLGIIVMMQVFAVSEARKRTTNAGSDAQGNAALALDGMRREISRAGYGFANTRLLNCNLQQPNNGAPGATIPLAPVIINPAAIPAGDANTDTLLVAYGSSDDQPEGYSVAYQTGATYTLDGTSVLLRVGPPADRVIAAPAACAATLRLGAVQTVNTAAITLSTSETGTALYNLGAAPRLWGYAVRNGDLTVCDFMTADCGALGNWQPVANNVVSLRAQYGQDTSGPQMDGTVDAYNRTTPTTNCGWARTSAVRLALVARSAQFEKDAVTTVAPLWTGSASAVPLSAQPINIDLSGDANWGNYRYRVFETVVPIRNVAWMGVPPGC